MNIRIESLKNGNRWTQINFSYNGDIILKNVTNSCILSMWISSMANILVGRFNWICSYEIFWLVKISFQKLFVPNFHPFRDDFFTSFSPHPRKKRFSIKRTKNKNALYLAISQHYYYKSFFTDFDGHKKKWIDVNDAFRMWLYLYVHSMYFSKYSLFLPLMAKLKSIWCSLRIRNRTIYPTRFTHVLCLSLWHNVEFSRQRFTSHHLI